MFKLSVADRMTVKSESEGHPGVSAEVGRELEAQAQAHSKHDRVMVDIRSEALQAHPSQLPEAEAGRVRDAGLL